MDEINDSEKKINVPDEVIKTILDTKEAILEIEATTVRIADLIKDPEVVSRGRHPIPNSYLGFGLLYLLLLHILGGLLFFTYYQYTDAKLTEQAEAIARLDQNYRDRLSNLEIIVDGYVHPVPWDVKKLP